MGDAQTVKLVVDHLSLFCVVVVTRIRDYPCVYMCVCVCVCVCVERVRVREKKTSSRKLAYKCEHADLPHKYCYNVDLFSLNDYEIGIIWWRTIWLWIVPQMICQWIVAEKTVTMCKWVRQSVSPFIACDSPIHPNLHPVHVILPTLHPPANLLKKSSWDDPVQFTECSNQMNNYPLQKKKNTKNITLSLLVGM